MGEYKGKVKFYNENKGFGFIVGEDGNEYFVHVTQIPENINLTENDEVVFDIQETPKGKQAQNVALA